MHVRRSAVLVLLIACGCALPSAAGAAPADRTPKQNKDAYVVVLRDAVSRPDATTDELERRRGFKARHRYSEALVGFSATLNANQVDRLRSDPEVAYVAPDRPVQATALEPVAAGDLVPAGIRRIEAATTTSARQAATRPVAVLDTGVAPLPDLVLTNGRDCTGSGSTADQHGHGTHVAGTIAGRNSGTGVVGVAPGTAIVPVKVLDAQGSGSWSSIICGIDHVAGTRTDADPANDVTVANMSLGGGGTPVGSCTTTTDALHQAVCRATAAGVLFVVAAGNDGWDFDYPSAPDVPAAYPQVLTVSATADTDGRGGALGATPSCRSGEADDRYASFSNYARTSGGAAHLIAGPGVCVQSLGTTGALATMSGTSMATPHVAGVAALCYGEAGAAGPCATLAPADALQRLRSDAQARAAALSSYGFTGDPLRPVSRGTFGYLAASPPAASAPDRTAPTVSSSAPADGATGVATTTAVTVTFSEAMDQAATQAAFALWRTSDGTAITGSASWSGATLTFRPSSALTAGTGYTAVVGTGARDLAGNALAAERRASFTTATSTSAAPGPASWSLTTGALRSGATSSLLSDDAQLLVIGSTTKSTRVTAWTGRFTGVPRTLKSLSVRLRASASKACTQVLSIWRPSDGRWVSLESRSLGATEVLSDRAVSGTLSSYVSSAGEVLARVRCTSTSTAFDHRTDQLGITYAT